MRYPDIRIRLDNQLALVDPNASDVDLAIRIGRGDYVGTEVEHLLTQYVVPVCSPAMATGIRQPADLLRCADHPRAASAVRLGCLGCAPRGSTGRFSGRGRTIPTPRSATMRRWPGQGVFLAFETLCRDGLDRGQVVAPIPRMHPNGLSYWLVSARDRPLSAPQKLFRRWLKAELAASGMGTGRIG